MSNLAVTEMGDSLRYTVLVCNQPLRELSLLSSPDLPGWEMRSAKRLQWQWSLAGKIIVGLVSQWPWVTRSIVYPAMGPNT